MKYIPTGIASIDEILGGGWQRPGVCEIFGVEQSGKTSLALASARSVDKVLFFDMDYTFPYYIGKNWGIEEKVYLTSHHQELNKLLWITQIIHEFVQAKPDLIIIDPLPVLTAYQVDLLLPELCTMASIYCLTVLLVNHVDGLNKPKFNDTLSYNCHQRLELAFKEGDEHSLTSLVRCIKNANHNSYKEGEFTINFPPKETAA